MRSSRRRSRIKRISGDNLITGSSPGGSPWRLRGGNWGGYRRDWLFCIGWQSSHILLLEQPAFPLRLVPLGLLVRPYLPSGIHPANPHTIPPRFLTCRRVRTDWPRSFQLSPDIDAHEVASAHRRTRFPSRN